MGIEHKASPEGDRTHAVDGLVVRIVNSLLWDYWVHDGGTHTLYTVMLPDVESERERLLAALRSGLPVLRPTIEADRGYAYFTQLRWDMDADRPYLALYPGEA